MFSKSIVVLTLIFIMSIFGTFPVFAQESDIVSHCVNFKNNQKPLFLTQTTFSTCVSIPDTEWIGLQACFPDSNNCQEQIGCICAVVCYDNTIASNDLPCFHKQLICF